VRYLLPLLSLLLIAECGSMSPDKWAPRGDPIRRVYETTWLSRREGGRVKAMSLIRMGLGLNLVGSIVVAAAGYFGLAAGFGGPIVWVSVWWTSLWWLGWVLVVAGFALQFYAA